MEKYKEVLLKRLFAIISYSGGLIVLTAVGLTRHSAGETEGVRSFMEGLNTGLIAAVLVMIAVTALRYLKALKSEEKLRALYINEHDERRLYIQSKTGGAAIQWILMGLAAATITSEFLNQTVFFTLLGALLFCAAVKAALKVYYTKRVSG
jgi:hypothetical protein